MPNHTVAELFELLAANPKRRQAELVFGEIMERYQKPLSAKIRYHIGRHDPLLVEDLLAAVFMDVWRKRATLRGVGNPEGWLLGVCRYKALDVMEKKLRREPSEVAWTDDYLEFPDSHPLFDKVLHRDLIETIRSELQELPPQRRKVFVMFRLDDLSIRAIANLLKLDEQTVKNHLQIAKKELRKKLGHIRKEGLR